MECAVVHRTAEGDSGGEPWRKEPRHTEEGDCQWNERGAWAESRRGSCKGPQWAGVAGQAWGE